MDERRATLYERLRRGPAPATVPGTLPVLFFGDLFQAEVATVGLKAIRQALKALNRAEKQVPQLDKGPSP